MAEKLGSGARRPRNDEVAQRWQAEAEGITAVTSPHTPQQVAIMQELDAARAAAADPADIPMEEQ